MTWLNSTINVDDAVARGLDIYELLIDNWGNAAAPSADGTSLMFPPLGATSLPSLAAISIGPRSTVDRAFIAYNLQKVIPANASFDYLRRVSVEAPLLFPSAANRATIPGVSPDPLANASIIVFPEDTLEAALGPNLSDLTTFGTSYIKADGTSTTWGAGQLNFFSPVLHLYLHLRGPTVPPPTQRFPYINQTGTSSVQVSTDRMIAQFPTFGRRRAVLRLNRFGGADTTDFRVATIDVKGSAGVPRETTVFTAPAMVPGTTARAVIDNPGDYLFVYYSTAGTTGSITINITAID